MANRLRRANRATIAEAFADGAAAVDAVANACRNRNLPAPATETPREAPRAERPERPERNRTSRTNDRNDRNQRPEFSDRGGRFERPSRTDRPEPSEYGPPPGYQPIILPGESISKYARTDQAPPTRSSVRPTPLRRRSRRPRPIAEVFADDEPIFRFGFAFSSCLDTFLRACGTAEPQFTRMLRTSFTRSTTEGYSTAWDREQQRLHQMNVAAVFGGYGRRPERCRRHR